MRGKESESECLETRISNLTGQFMSDECNNKQFGLVGIFFIQKG